MSNHLLELMGASSAPVPWGGDDGGGVEVSGRCIGATLIHCALESGMIQDGEGVTTDSFPTANAMVETFGQIFPNMAQREPDRLQHMTSAMIGHNDASGRNPDRMRKAWANVEHIMGRERNLALLAA